MEILGQFEEEEKSIFGHEEKLIVMCRKSWRKLWSILFWLDYFEQTNNYLWSLNAKVVALLWRYKIIFPLISAYFPSSKKIHIQHRQTVVTVNLHSSGLTFGSIFWRANNLWLQSGLIMQPLFKWSILCGLQRFLFHGLR